MTDASRDDGPRRRGIILAFLTTARPKQWIKNLFVFGPLLFSHKIGDDLPANVDAFIAFVLFCLASTAVYILNDLMDLDADRRHPTKCHRPIARGEITRSAALTVAGGLIALTGIASLLLSPVVTLLILAYMVLNVAYSLGLKHVVIVDVMMIGAGVDARTIQAVTHGSRGLLLTVPIVMYGIFRYLYLVYHREQGDSPTNALLKDRMMMLCITVWAALCMAVIYFPDSFKGWFSR